ncbi:MULTISPECIES: FAD-dependent oxidoreductase [Methanobacterium]|uniref:Glucose-methanol-choline oxidoreductase n=1 Tax=Methanobacterium formicicum TaxID=2162 RepID=A0A090I4P9_METFO|nr:MULTISPECIES: GMC family oxidoreductase [Methanobacterium]KUK71610.1 MAG: Choline dehydrogenase-like flavoprotein [Methanobacterium sp. 42_16]MDG3547353.1 GMC family oxidoreductase [Methanobacterium formicicum]MDH2659414.1 GMC family oxidoreductase [Methanobacterium formicicum]CEA14259.1 glucose-methanol-choline oxidoreductase [Methanobacterium formicicum]
MNNIIVVGSGAGGATVARELAIQGMDVTLIEKGSSVPSEKAFQCYDNLDVGVELLKTTCLGGTTLVTAGNAVRTCQQEFQKLGIDLSGEFEEVEAELKVGPLPDTHFGEGTMKIMEASASLGLTMEKMPKFINPAECVPCGKCAFGCPRNAKWSSLEYLAEAEKHGAHIVDNSPITRIMTPAGQVKGVEILNSENGVKKEYIADTVILCSGAIETPRLLRSAGLTAGERLFVDTFVTVGGVLPGINFYKEVSMNGLYKKEKRFILSPHYSSLLTSPNQVTEKDILGIMVKIPDESSGRVDASGVFKQSTSQDVGLMAEGCAAAGAILTEAGVSPDTLVSTPARGAHPGGTAAVGEVVDKNLETEIENLFVADASVFPRAPGAPPVLTILALAKRLAKHVVSLNQ